MMTTTTTTTTTTFDKEDDDDNNDNDNDNDHPTLHHTSIIHVYEVFEHLHMLWNGIWVHPHTVTPVQVEAKLWIFRGEE